MILSINEWCQVIHTNSINKGFARSNKQRPIPELLCLIHSEISEALEAYRIGSVLKFNEEIADACIRLFDLAAEYTIDLEYCIERKHKINLQRPYKHGNKKI